MTGKVDTAAYSSIALKPSGNWWRRLLSPVATACTHGESGVAIALNPDYVRLRDSRQAAVHQPARPPISVCPECLLTLLEPELTKVKRRIIAFEADKDGLAEYAFIEQDHLGDAPLPPEDVIHCQSLMAEPLGGCQKCGNPALFLLVKRGITTQKGKLHTFRGGKEYYCPAHGSERLLGLLRERLAKSRRVGYFNFPYGERGVYIPTD